MSVWGLSPPADVPWGWPEDQDWDLPLDFSWMKPEG